MQRQATLFKSAVQNEKCFTIMHLSAKVKQFKSLTKKLIRSTKDLIGAN